MKILITGAGGFVGQRVVEKAVSLGYTISAITRLPQCLSSSISSIGLGSIDENTNWCDVLRGCEGVVHLAARAHILNESIENPLAEFRKVNVGATVNLARQSARVGVRRFVFVSSIGVNGAETFDRPYSADDLAAPHSSYTTSKYEAEQGLLAISNETGMEVVIVRPPLIYGPNAPGNFGLLMRLIARGAPLPFGTIHNKRSFVGLDNLTDLLFNCLTHPAAAGQILLVSDGEDVSTTQLLRRTAQAMGKPVRFVPVPAGLLQWTATLLGKRDLAQRLCGSLQVDIGKTRQLLGWSPPLTLDQGLKNAVEGLRV